MAVLKAQNLAKTYSKRKVVTDVSLQVESGQIVGLLGPNGAGKTTSFYMIVGLVARDEGTISIDDNDISILPMHSRSRLGIGYLPQEASIFRKLSVEDNIMSVLQTRKELTPEERQDKLEDLLEEFHIQHIANATDFAFVRWVMILEHPKLAGGNEIKLDGVSELKIDNNLIVAQTDFYDMGAMFYEHIPVLKNLVRFVKNKIKNYKA